MEKKNRLVRTGQNGSKCVSILVKTVQKGKPQILALRVYNMPTMSTISRPRLPVVHSVYRPQTAHPLYAGKRLQRTVLGEGGLWPPSQILALRVYNMPTVSTISRPRLLVVHIVYRPQTAHPLCAGKRLQRTVLGEGGLRPPSQILALRVYNMPTVSTISRPRLLVVHSVYRPQTALPLYAGKRWQRTVLGEGGLRPPSQILALRVYNMPTVSTISLQCIYVCVCVYIYIYTYIHIYTYICRTTLYDASYCVVLCRTVSYCVVQCRTVSYCVVLCRTVSYCVVQCRTVSYCVVLCRTVSYCVVLCRTVYTYIHIYTYICRTTLYDASYCVVLCRTVSYCVVLCRTVSYCVVLCRTVSYSVVLCRTVSYCVVLCRTASYCVVLCRTVSYCVVQCRTTLYDASYSVVQCRTVSYSVVQCRTASYSVVRHCTTHRTVSYKVSGPDASGMYDASYSVVQGVGARRVGDVRRVGRCRGPTRRKIPTSTVVPSCSCDWSIPITARTTSLAAAAARAAAKPAVLLESTSQPRACVTCAVWTWVQEEHKMAKQVRVVHETAVNVRFFLFLVQTSISPLTRLYLREFSESGIRAVQCCDHPTVQCGSGGRAS